MNTSTTPPTQAGSGESVLYRRVWRWHFYAGLICLPFLVLLAVTGGLYLFKDSIEAQLYRSLQTVAAQPGTGLSPEALLVRALAAEPGEAVRYVAPAHAGRSAEVGVRTVGQGVVAVFLDPADGRILGRLPDQDRLMETIKDLHSLALAGPIANHGVEIVAGWAIVLVVSGVFLWWPRGKSGGVYSLRGRPAQRSWWRDLHAVTGITAAALIVFLAATGMPWSAFWGKELGRISTEHGLGMPRYVWGPPPLSAEPALAVLGALPWGTELAPLPQSALPAGQQEVHAHVGLAQAPAPTPDAASSSTPPSLGLNAALERFAALGLPAGTPVRLPAGPRGVYSAVSFPADVRGERVVHLDRYTGAVLADVGYAQYGAVARVTQWGVSLHTGRQFGAINQGLMLAGCLAIVLLALSALVMWWKRRPRGRLAAPPKRAGDRAARSAVAVATLLGLIYPLLGASMLAALLIDAMIPQRWHQRFGL